MSRAPAASSGAARPVAIIRGIYGAECEPEPEFRTVPTFATTGECRAWAARAGAGTVCTNPERPAFRQHIMMPFDDLYGRLDF